MCFSSGPKPKTPVYINRTPGQGEDMNNANLAEQRRRRQLAAGQESTILTSAQGDTSTADTARKTLLGQ